MKDVHEMEAEVYIYIGLGKVAAEMIICELYPSAVYLKYPTKNLRPQHWQLFRAYGFYRTPASQNNGSQIVAVSRAGNEKRKSTNSNKKLC